MKKRKCKHCPIPGCGSKYLFRLANHLTQVHELTELERKYWLHLRNYKTPTGFVCMTKRLNPKPFFYKSASVLFNQSVPFVKNHNKHYCCKTYLYFDHSIKYVKMKLHGVFNVLCYCPLFLYISAIFRETKRKAFFDKALYKEIISTFIARKTMYNSAHANLARAK